MIYHSIFLNFGPRTPPPQLEDWVQKSFPEATHANRLAGLYSSRYSLWENIRKIDPTVTFAQLELRDYGQLLHYPDLVASLSHTPKAGASAVAYKKEFISIGIDIESLDRQVKDHIIERVITEQDLKLSNHEVWCLKEAIYKCVSNSKLYSGVLEFRDMVIKDHRWEHSPSGIHGEWELFIEENHQLALATLRNQNS